MSEHKLSTGISPGLAEPSTRDLGTLAVVMLGGIATDGFDVELTEKSRLGLAAYASYWPGKVVAIGALRRPDPSGNIGSKTFRAADLEFEVIGSGDVQRDLQNIRPAVVLAPHHLSSISLMDLGAPVVLVSEVSAVDGAQPALQSSRSAAKRARIILGAQKRELVLRRLAKQADGLQCNGWTAWHAYSALNHRSIRFYDTRVSGQELITGKQLGEKFDNDRPLRLAFSGRFIPIKGPEFATRLHRELNRRGVGHSFTLVGQGPMLDELQHTENGRIRFLSPMDFRSEWQPWARNDVDIMVLPHVQGDPSGTYLESAAMGAPILGFENKALVPLIEESGLGWAVPQRDVSAMADVIERLAVDRGEIHRAAEAGREFMAQHTFEAEFRRRVQHLVSIAESAKSVTTKCDSSTPGKGQPEMVIISPILPSTNPDNAGEWYLKDLLTALDGQNLAFIVPDTPGNRRAAAAPDVPNHHLVNLRPGLEPRGVFRAIRDQRDRTFVVHTYRGFERGIVQDLEARELIERANRVDLQWEQQAPLVRMVRRLNPRADVIVTLHDVMSQGLKRRVSTATGWKDRIRGALAFANAAIVEHRLASDDSTTVVFSEKDRKLLPDGANAVVIHPAIARRSKLTKRVDAATTAPNALFIGPLHRPENLEGVLWLTRDVWPLVRNAIPNATLTVAGSVPEEYRPMLPALGGVTYAGFVEDLDALYAATDIAVAPLLQGAGVKFKVVEAIARGVPVALTSIAAEGIGDNTYQPQIYDDAPGFASRIIQVLSDPASARDDAVSGAHWASSRYGTIQFANSLRSVYGANSLRDVSRERSAADRRIPRIAMVTPWRFDDPRAWSGMIAHMQRVMGERVELVPISTEPVSTAIIDRVATRVIGAISNRKYLWDFGLATALRRGRSLKRRLRNEEIDAVLAVVASTDIAFLGKIGAPIIQVTDATLIAMRDFYAMFSNVHPVSSIQADAVSARATRTTEGFVASSAWAKNSLVLDYGVRSEHVVVAPTGPAILPPEPLERPAPVSGPLRLLLVSTEWERKGGTIALKAVEEARSRGLEAGLVIVGDAPASLPAWAEPMGRLSREALSAEYVKADILIELATANAAGVTLTDAAAHGLPAIAADVGGVASIVKHDLTGLLVKSGESIVADAATAIFRMSDPGLRAKYSSSAIEWSRTELNWEVWADRTLDLCLRAGGLK
ncbi:glycosyltransferase [Gulosibacter molinativorax]|nr:glycosyltransferase [Gulosibacter molinativorax]